VVGYIRLPTTILSLRGSGVVEHSPENTIAPCRNSFLLGRVKFICPGVVFVCWDKVDWAFLKRTKAKPTIELHLFQKLVMDLKILMFSGTYGSDNHFPAGFDAIVQISADLGDL
jgi:hypothetical protein